MNLIDEFTEKHIMILIEDILEPSVWKEVDGEHDYYYCHYCYGRAKRRFQRGRQLRPYTPEEKLESETVIHEDNCIYIKALMLRKHITKQEDIISDREIQFRSEGIIGNGDDTF